MNLSILIPCYNWDIYNLVLMLHSVCVKEPRLNEFEIICLEDGSTNCFKNKNICTLSNTKYEILTHNIGRSRIRNLIAKKGNYKWLLFIDCDSKITNQFFIAKYIDCIIKHEEKNNNQKITYYGSTVYSSEKPDFKKILHWKYGRKIESKRKSTNFSSHHFLIQKEMFTKYNIEFDEKILSYGYEDVFFIIKNNIKPIYINNPAYHTGIKNTNQFIHDTESALKNLILHQAITKNLEKRIKIIKVSKIISQLFLTQITIMLFEIFKILILKNLNSKKPSLLLFQFYKLGYFLKESIRFYSIKKS